MTALGDEPGFAIPPQVEHPTDRPEPAQPSHPGRPFDVFLSYNRVDEAVVEQVASRLREEGLNPWIDLWTLTPGRGRRPHR